MLSRRLPLGATWLLVTLSFAGCSRPAETTEPEPPPTTATSPTQPVGGKPATPVGATPSPMAPIPGPPGTPPAHPDTPTATEPPVAIPIPASPTCPGMDGTAPRAMWNALDAAPFGVQPHVLGFPLGAPYPLSRLFDGEEPQVQGRVLYAQGVGNSFFTGSDAGSDIHYARRLNESTLAELIPDPARAPNGEAYGETLNGVKWPWAWMKLAATPDNAVTFFDIIRVDAGEATLLPESHGNATGDYVAGGYYTQYLAFVVHLVFDSACKRDLYLAKGDGSLDAIFPKNDTKGLGAFLTAAKAQIVVRALTLGKAAEVEAAVKPSTCATNDLAACNKLVADLSKIARTVGTNAVPDTFVAKPEGVDGWFVDQVYRTPTGN